MSKLGAGLNKIASGVFRGPRRLITDRIFARQFGARDFAKGNLPSAPFDGQRGRRAAAESVIKTCGTEQIVETGTYRGTTTEWFASFGLPVYSVEANPRFAEFCRLRLADKPHVHLAEMDSAAFLKLMAVDPALTQPVTLFYLDAHWGPRLPLGEEISTIAGAFDAPIILIDDFKVPDDPDYGFDDYGLNKRLDIDYVRRTGVSGLSAFFPVMPGSDEDLPRRGFVVLTTNAALAGTLGRNALLRPYRL